MSRLYLYKLTNIDETVPRAPCVRDGILSLAICKPAIRRTARPGDLVFGVAGTSCIPGNPLVYVARVDENLHGHDYYGNSDFAWRADCIYEPHVAGYRLRPGAGIHTEPAAQRTDLGDAPHFRNARVLVCREYAYFGQQGPSDYKSLFPRIAGMVAALMQGHRVNHGDDARVELLALYHWALQRSAGTRRAPERARRTSGGCA